MAAQTKCSLNINMMNNVFVCILQGDAVILVNNLKDMWIIPSQLYLGPNPGKVSFKHRQLALVAQEGFPVSLTCDGERDILGSAPGLVLSHTGKGARVSLFCPVEDQVQVFLVHPALRGHPVTFPLPPHLGVGPPCWGVTGHPLHGVGGEHPWHPWRHASDVCSKEQGDGNNGAWSKDLKRSNWFHLIINFLSESLKHFDLALSNTNSQLRDFLTC